MTEKPVSREGRVSRSFSLNEGIGRGERSRKKDESELQQKRKGSLDEASPRFRRVAKQGGLKRRSSVG